MGASLWGFPRPCKLEDLKLGDLFFVQRSEGRYVCLAFRDARLQEEGWLVLAGPNTGEPIPRMVSWGVLSGEVSRPPDLPVTIEPVKPGVVPEPTSDQPSGTLVIDGGGEAWVWVTESATTRANISLASFATGVPRAPRAYFTRWRIVLRDGQRLITVAEFEG